MLSNVFNVDRRPPPSPQMSSSLQPPIPRQSGSGSLEGAPSTATGSSASAGGESRTRTNLIDQFSAILLLTFIDSGLVEVSHCSPTTTNEGIVLREDPCPFF